MKIKLVCHRCHIENGTSMLELINKGIEEWEEPTIELDKWPYIEMKCKNGHRQRFMISTELFELLFEQATRCLADGYYREAIGTYNAALERFFEYAIEMMLTSKSQADFSSFWKSISAQSERQLGAYYALWTQTFNELPTFLNQDKVKLRNDVVHKGKLASKKEAEDFGEYVFNYIISAAKRIQNNIPNAHLIQISRLARLCESDFEKEANDPIIVDYRGQPSILATSSLKISCLLNNPNIQTYRDCLNVDFKNPYLKIL